jgi:hypothetical protein
VLMGRSVARMTEPTTRPMAILTVLPELTRPERAISALRFGTA